MPAWILRIPMSLVTWVSYSKRWGSIFPDEVHPHRRRRGLRPLVERINSDPAIDARAWLDEYDRRPSPLYQRTGAETRSDGEACHRLGRSPSSDTRTFCDRSGLAWVEKDEIWQPTRGHSCIVSSPYYLDLHYPADSHYGYFPDMSSKSWTAANQSMANDPRLAHVKDGVAWGFDFGSFPDLQEGREGRILGGEACMWSELVDTSVLSRRVWSRMPLIAERFWNGDSSLDGR